MMKQITTNYPPTPLFTINNNKQQQSNTGERELPMKQYCLVQNYLLIFTWIFEIEKTRAKIS